MSEVENDQNYELVGFGFPDSIPRQSRQKHVVLDDHQVPGKEVIVDAAGSI